MTDTAMLNSGFRIFSALLVAVPVVKSCVLYTCAPFSRERTKSNYAFTDKRQRVL
jgi:hypothetical protein